MLKKEEWKSARDHGGRRWTTMCGIRRQKGGTTERNYEFERFCHIQSRELEDTIENLQLVTKIFLILDRDCSWSSGGQ